MPRTVLCATLITTLMVCAPDALHAVPFTFQGLGDLPGGTFLSRAYGVSADGSVIVGYGNSASGTEAFRWTAGGGMVGLGDLPGGTFFSEAYGLSADGSVVAGWSNSTNYLAFRWTSEGGMVSLGDLPGGIVSSRAIGVSADGSVVVGAGNSTSGGEAFRWTSGGGMVGLGDLPGGAVSSGAFAVSADGSVVVGVGSSASGGEAFRWTSGGGMVGLGDLAGGIFASEARGISADGSVVVGRGNSTSGFEAFRWTSGGGMVGLGDLPAGGFASLAAGASADGSIVVGTGTTALGSEAFLWTSLDGMESLADVLLAGGATGLAGWLLRSAEAVSADGRTIVGWGTNPDGFTEAWIATVPEPSTLALGACAVAALVLLRCWRRFPKKSNLAGLMVVWASCLLLPAATFAVTIPTVYIGDVGNVADTEVMTTDSSTGYGSVSYAYRIGTTEVTNTQYAAFLNAVAASDPYQLYNVSMGSSAAGGIIRSGSPGSYTYFVKAAAAGQGPGGTDYTYDTKPVNFVNWYDAIRFANWLHNGQGTGDTENGAYTLLGGTPTPSNGSSIARNAGATWFLPSEDEWYKAAYFDPQSSTFHDYPTGTDATPDNDLPSADSGNSANFHDSSGYTTGNLNYPVTDSGAYALSASPYGTLDQGGNLTEWNESLLSGGFRGSRGGSWGVGENLLRASFRQLNGNPISFQIESFGFRVATVPEPGTLVLTVWGALGVMVVAVRRRIRFLRIAAVTSCISVASLGAAHATPFTFQGLGDLTGGDTWSAASGISDDGTVVVGSSNSANGREAIRWTAGSGMLGLGDLAGGVYSSRGSAISGDGSVITGWSSSALGRQVIRWTQSTGMVGLGDLPGGATEGFGQGINYDGSVIVGQGETADGTRAFRWTAGGGMVALDDGYVSSAFGTDADGTFSVGVYTDSFGVQNGNIWLNDSSWSHLGGPSAFRAVAVGPGGGLLIVGSNNLGSGNEAILLISGSSLNQLGDLPGGAYSSIALDLSADGSVVVGQGTSAIGSEAFLWAQSLGMVNLRNYLIAHGATGLTNWTLTSATGISADGRTIVGEGINPLGFNEGWIATVPEPSTLVLAACAGCCLIVVRRMRVRRLRMH